MADSAGYYWKLNGASYGEVPKMLLQGNFEIHTTVNWNPVGSGEDVLLSSVDNRTLVIFKVDGEILVRFSGGARDFQFFTRTELRGKYLAVSIYKEDTTVFITVDGVRHDTSSEVGASASLVIERVGIRTGVSSLFQGQVKYLHIKGISNLDAYPSGEVFYKLDEPYSNDHIAYDSAPKLGGDIAINGTFENGGQGWINQTGWSFKNDKAFCDSNGDTGTRDLYQSDLILKLGHSYLIKGFADIERGGLGFWEGSNLGGARIATESGYFEYIIKNADIQRIYFYAMGDGIGGAGLVGFIDNISCQEIYLPQLIENGDFEDGVNGWSGFQGATLEANNNELTVTGKTGAYSSAIQYFTVEDGEQLIIEGDSFLINGAICWVIINDSSGENVLLSFTSKNTWESKKAIYSPVGNSVYIELQLHNTGTPPKAIYRNISVKKSTDMLKVNDLYTDYSPRPIIQIQKSAATSIFDKIYRPITEQFFYSKLSEVEIMPDFVGGDFKGGDFKTEV